MLTFQEPFGELKTGRITRGSSFGVVELVHETYPCSVTDPRTGFTVDAGRHMFIHVVKERLSVGYMPYLAADLSQAAHVMNRSYRPEDRTQNVFSITHRAMARLACRFGFSYFLPDENFISEEGRETLTGTIGTLRKRGVGTHKDERPLVIFMPTEDLLATYGGLELPTQQEISTLAMKARAESAAIERHAKERAQEPALAA